MTGNQPAQSPEVKSEIAADAPAIEEKRARFNESVSGQADCDTAKDQGIDEAVSTDILTIEVTEPMQIVEQILENDEKAYYAEVGALNFKIDRKNKIDADMIEIKNRTTCSMYARSKPSEVYGASLLEAEVIPLEEVRQVKVLPIGQMHFDVNESMVLDPLKANYLDVVFKKCRSWKTNVTPATCETARTVERKTIVLSLDKSKTRYHRNLRPEEF